MFYSQFIFLLSEKKEFQKSLNKLTEIECFAKRKSANIQEFEKSVETKLDSLEKTDVSVNKMKVLFGELKEIEKSVQTEHNSIRSLFIEASTVLGDFIEEDGQKESENSKALGLKVKIIREHANEVKISVDKMKKHVQYAQKIMLEKGQFVDLYISSALNIASNNRQMVYEIRPQFFS